MVFSLVLPTTVARVRSSFVSKSLSSHTIRTSCAFLSNADTSIKNNTPKQYDSISPLTRRMPSPVSSSLRMNSSYNSAGDSNHSNNQDEDNPNSFSLSGYQRPKVNWYPGHIAKAERQLSETLKSVDVVIEVRDARAPKATAHPSVGKWSAGRPRVVVLTRVDTVTTKSRETWRDAYERLGADKWEEKLDGEERNRNVQLKKERSKYDDGSESSGSGEDGVEEVLFVDAKRGQGTHAITRAVYRAGRHVNDRRNRRGLNDRPLRVGIIGFPNVGKSALINRLLGRKRARTANTPGITRSLQWIRVATDKLNSASTSGASGSRGGSNANNTRKKGFELLDSPGIIPSDLLDQNDALLLAACNSVGVGAYDNQAVAAYLCDRIQSLILAGGGTTAAPVWRQKCIERYGFDPILPLSEQKIAARWGAENTDGSANTWIQFASANQDRIPTGEDMLFIVADNTCNGDPENAARKILQDFRGGRMGPVALQLAPKSEKDDGQTYVENTGLNARQVVSPTDFKRAVEEQERNFKEEIEQRAAAAQEAAKEKGLKLPPVMERAASGEDAKEDGSAQKPAESEVGKGLFDGW
eukprot:CAMPEP_0201905328 /NCGR_PEP_ID=MMETSP0902-20130614/56455_1 /ASSEMBLY_ACC=CAM_ASM_000551 /TAXON_ID=420261 /ORGANISM="Thalassiosira antarctica, Strain CCMP982" /LENGTH=583 /DNA_ID=CAMNT_0048439439 /DNA_START=272 /DNA_END=2023 /DNA_ORIENTATION=+